MKHLDTVKFNTIKIFLSKNKYKILIIGALVYMAFFDRYNFINQWRLSSTINQMEQEMEDYRTQIEETRMLMESIDADIEGFARERYYMHKADEDVYIFNDAKE